MAEHDAGYKLLFSFPQTVRSFLENFLPPEWQDMLNLDSLEKMNGSYVTEDLRSRHNDVIWRLRCGDGWLYLYLLLEFQSSVDHMMALRILVYTGLLHQDLERQGQLGESDRLPTVLPVVLYNGKPRWDAPVELAKLIVPPPPGFERFQPNQSFLLVDEGAYDPDALDPASSLVASIFRLEHHRSMGEMFDLAKAFQDWLDQPEQANMRVAGTEWLVRRLHAWCPDKPAPKATDLLEGRKMLKDFYEEWKQEHHQAGLAEGMQQGMQQGVQQGIVRGVAQGEQTLLLRLLHRRFGKLPEATRQRLENASPDELETWADRILDAKTLAEVFR